MSYAITPGFTTVSEGGSTLTFTIIRSNDASAETLYVSTAPIYGYANSGDYTGLLNKVISFAAGQVSLTVTIAIHDDATSEPAETFGIILQQNASDPVGTYLAKADFTILDNDGGTPPFSPIALTMYPAIGVDSIGQGNRDSEDSHAPGTARQWAYDFLTSNGTDVHAIAGGIVVAVRDDLTGAFRGYGNVVTILCDGGFYATYAHLAAFSASVSVGMRVEVGQIIALSGDSGSLEYGTLHPNLHIQLGTAANYFDANFSDSSTDTLIADGSGDYVAPAYFPTLFIDFSNRSDPDLSTDTDYYGTMGIDNFTGNEFANSVFGGGGDDILRGENGDDALQGAEGNDIIDGGAGSDITDGGAGNDVIRGGAGADVMFGGNGSDVLSGGSGIDTMAGGTGDDLYMVSVVLDQTVELAGEGWDKVYAPISWTLSDNTEALKLTGVAVINGTGNGLANLISGNPAANVLRGEGDSDILIGMDGNDTLIGGAGVDTLIGGGGADIFRFAAPIAGYQDRIRDFIAGVDHLEFASADYGLPVGILAPDRFELSDHASLGRPEFFFDPSTHRLFWDADGIDKGSVLIGIFQTSDLPTASDIFIV